MCSISVPDRKLLISRIIDSVSFKMALAIILMRIDFTYELMEEIAEEKNHYHI